MTRSLRPRKKTQNYALLNSLPDDIAGPSNAAELEDPDSGSDFAPEQGGQDAGGDEEVDDEEDEDEEMEEDELDV